MVNSVAMYAIPQIQIFSHVASEEFPEPFNELAYRNEGFRPIPYEEG